jgi:hypothetical protein
MRDPEVISPCFQQFGVGLLVRNQSPLPAQKPRRARPSTTFSEQIIEPLLIVGGFRLVFGRNHAQLCAIDAYLGLDIAPSRDFPEIADQLLPVF